jgi:uncharacterized membrane protein YgaE (UPF0421/DUF939 family)
MNKAEKTLCISRTDVEMALAILISLVLGNFIPQYQAMTACIAVLLCVQEGVKESWKACVIRLLITVVGGITGIIVVLADNAMGNQGLFILMISAGILLTFFGCKLAKVPVFNSRIGCVTFILVVLTKTGDDRIWYALFRLLSTLYGAVAVMVVSLVFQLLTSHRR